MKNTYRIIQRIDTWATVEVEADTHEQALAIAEGPDLNCELDWSYDTDYDSAKTETWDLISEGVDDSLLGVTFVDPYLGRDDVVWEVNASVGDGDWQAEIIASDDDNDLGEMDLYGTDFIQNNRIER